MKAAWLLVWWLALAPLLAQSPVWDPGKTWVFAVGVLNFDNPKLTTWPDEGRVDQVMIDAYRERGVPEEQIVFIKNADATKAEVTRRFAEFLRRAGNRDTLVFYYAGHGSRNFKDAARPVSFMTYDSNANWSTLEVLDAIRQNFNGTMALITVDCCHAGQIALDVARRNVRPRYGVITSSQASAKSTGNWTFTQCLVDALRGKAQLDFDGNGAITFAEVAKHCDLEMAFCENQRTGYFATGGFPQDLVLAKTSAPDAPRVGERCEGEYQGKWSKVKILAAKDGKFHVTWIGRAKKFDSWVKADQLRPHTPKSMAAGTPVEIEWRKKWYPGHIVRSELGLLLVHYDGYPATDDEWLPMHRVRVGE